MSGSDVPKHYWKFLDQASTLADALDYVVRMNHNDYSKAIEDERIRDVRPAFAKFVEYARPIKKDLFRKDDRWTRDPQLKNLERDIDL